MPDPAPCLRHPRDVTRVRCAGCDAPICPACMHTNGAGLLVCPACTDGARRTVLPRDGAGDAVRAMPVTIALMAAALVAYLVQVVQAGQLIGGAAQSRLGERWGIYGPAVADGEWWRLLTYGFVHGGLIHIAMNLIILWWVGRMLEPLLGPGRYLGVFLISVVAGGAVALLLAPGVPGVGMSGGVFGLMACELVMEWRRSGSPMRSPVWVLFVLNLVLTFVIPGVSVGGHLGGALGGAGAGALIALGDARRMDARLTTALLGVLVVVIWALGLAVA